MTSLTTILHPIPKFFNPDSYSIEKGQYLTAFFVYGIHWLSTVLLTIIVTKYLMIGIERLIAFKLRADYENKDAKGATKLLIYYVGF